MRSFRIFFVPFTLVLLGFAPTAEIALRVAIGISVSKQTLTLYREGRPVKTYRVSTSKHGTGNKQLSNRTPLGRHVIAKKIGEGAPPLTVFKNRLAVGRLNRVNLTREPLKEDLITSRILWLKGLEPGVNQGRRVDSFHRLIYIHGTADEGLIGTPASHGCVRMKNVDVVELFGLVEVGTPVTIEA